MRQFRTVAVLCVLLMVIGLFCACAGKEIVEEQLPKPDWVEKGSGAFEGDRGKIFYGVGSAWGIKSPSLQRSTADNRARTEVARVFKIYVAALMKDYQASTMAGDPNVTSEEQHVEQTIKTFTKAELAGVEIVDHWKNYETGEFFALARMDLSVFEDYLKRSAELSDAVRERVIEHAEKAFKDLEAEEAKHE